MPELPEVETVCRGLSNTLLNLNIQKVKVINFNLRYRIPLQLEKKLFNAKLSDFFNARRQTTGYVLKKREYKSDLVLSPELCQIFFHTKLYF